ncbi:MAG: hypothetical protein ACNS60_09695 [Candidatus Cyclobacteriaceae bacterium M2_1C_046]
MELDEIREKLAIKISQQPEVWDHELTDTNPNNYGASYWHVDLDYNNLYVDIPNKTFNFKDALFQFTVRLGASKKDGFDQTFTKFASGKGEFEFENGNNDVKIKQLGVIVDLNLFN